MRRTPIFALVLFLTTFGGVQASHIGADQGRGDWTTLFDGKSLNGWNAVGDANWNVADGVVQANKGTGYLVTSASYRDFQITLDFWVTDDANSGVFIRCSDPKSITATSAYEVNIYDQRPDPTYCTGAIVNVVKPTTFLK